MSFIKEITSSLSPKWQDPKEQIQLKISFETCPPELIVNHLASVEGPIDIYTWYEGPQNLPKSGADFMKKKVFEPLYKRKKDAKIYLYSLKAWNFQKSVESMPLTTGLGEAINRINNEAIECIYSSSFFRFCAQVSKESGLYRFINEELAKKEWLYNLSAKEKKRNTTVEAFFHNEDSYFDCIKDKDVSSAYSAMQYMEGYYLIRESVKKGLSKGQKMIEIAFVHPNDESKYYQDFPNDIQKMLTLDFGMDLTNVKVNISLKFFAYGESLTSRPYIDKKDKAPKVKAEEIPFYFDYLPQTSFSQQKPKVPFLRYDIHNLNGGY
jgi:hypothetical protein